jgi:hypothetical protein
MNMWSDKSRGVRGCAFVIAASVVAFGAPAVKAALIPLAPGGSINFLVTSGAIPAGLVSGPTVASTGPLNLTDTGGLPLVGTVSTQVVADANNPFGAGDYTFIYQVNNTGTPGVDDPFSLVSIRPFGLSMTDVGYVQTNIDPSSADRNGTNTIDWSFAGTEITPGTSTDLLVVETNATAIAPGTFAVSDGGSANGTAAVPFVGNGVPEPASVSLIVAASGLMLGRRRRRV